MCKWAANSINLYRVQDHGVTAHEAVGGRQCKTPICPFGEHIQWKKQRDGAHARKAESDWFDGIFLGVRPISGECIVGSSSGVVYCRTIRRVIDTDRWSMQAIKEVSQTVREVECAHHGGSYPARLSTPVLVGWKDIGVDCKSKDAEEIPVPEDNSLDKEVEDWMDNIGHDLASQDSDRAFELFGPDSEDELESAPGSPHHDDCEITTILVRKKGVY